MKEDRKRNPQKYKDRDYKRRTAFPKKRLLMSTRQTAKKKGIEHTITEMDLFLPERCPYLGVLIDYSAGKGKHMLNPSIDRIDPSKGYIPGNVEVISNLANSMKNKATVNELLTFASTIIKRYGTSL